jgi:hypothetical protein
MRHGIVNVYEAGHLPARVRKNPVAEWLIANPWTTVSVERNIPVGESAERELGQSRTQAVTRKTDLRLWMTLAVIRNAWIEIAYQGSSRL